MPDTVQPSETPRPSERRLHPRKQLWFPSIQLGAANGGIILDISESGLAMRAARSLVDDQLPAMRFQLSESQPWIETRGRIAWISASKTRVGVEFVGLPEEARNQIKDWIPLPLHPNGSTEEAPLVERTEPVKDVVPASGPESAMVPEPKTTGRVDESQSRYSNTEDPVGVLHSTAETQDSETGPQDIGDKNIKPAVSQSARYDTSPTLCLSYQETTSSPETSDRGRTAGSSKSPKRTFLFLTALLLLSGFFLLGPFFRRVAHGSQGTAVTVGAKVAELSPDSSANPKTLSVDPSLSWDQPGFVLQVGAMAHEENADALAESLRQRNFPVIVSRSGTRRLYRVVVGPYNDVDSTLRVQEQLKKQGFDAFRTAWNPSAQ